MKKLPYIGIILLLLIVLLQNRSCNDQNGQYNAPKVDTVYVHNIVRDTIVIEKPVLVYSKPDTVWMKKEENAPDSTYEGLLNQYTQLGDRHFTTNVFTSKFEIGDYGFVTVTDSIYGNWLMSSTLVSDLDIIYPEITIEKIMPARTQMYIGTTFTGNKYSPLSGVYGNMLLKTKKDRIYGLSVGYTGQIEYGFSMYWKIKLNKD